MNLQRGDMVVYGIHGVCRIADIEMRTVDRKSVEYFVLSPVSQADAKFYVPTQNPAAVAKIRKMLTKEQLNALLASEEVRLDAWIDNENQRKEAYRKLITRADCAELLQMLRALHSHKQAQLAAGKKFHLCDENFMRDAERLIRSEVSLVLEIPSEEVGTYLRDRVENRL